MSIHDFLELLPDKVRNLPQIRAMANLIERQAELIQKQKKRIATLQKTVNELKKKNDENVGTS